MLGNGLRPATSSPDCSASASTLEYLKPHGPGQIHRVHDTPLPGPDSLRTSEDRDIGRFQRAAVAADLDGDTLALQCGDAPVPSRSIGDLIVRQHLHRLYASGPPDGDMFADHMHHGERTIRPLFSGETYLDIGRRHPNGDQREFEVVDRRILQRATAGEPFDTPDIYPRGHLRAFWQGISANRENSRERGRDTLIRQPGGIGQMGVRVDHGPVQKFQPTRQRSGR